MVTAHAGLGVGRVVRVPPLGLPAGPEDVGAPAVRLLAARAEVDAAAHAADLCALATAVDGVPLALELVAAHVGTLGPAEVRAALGASAGLGVDAMLAATWERLPPWVRGAVRQLASFRRAFTVALAAEVLEVPDAPDAAEVVSALVARGLATPVGDGWFRLFDLVQRHARGRGEDAGAVERLIAAWRHRAEPLLTDGTYGSLPVRRGPAVDELDHAAERSIARSGLAGPPGAVAVLAYVAAAQVWDWGRAERWAARLADAPLSPPVRAWFTAVRAHQLARLRGAEPDLAALPAHVDAIAAAGLPVLAAETALRGALWATNHGDGALGATLAERAHAVAPGSAGPVLALHAALADTALQLGRPGGVDGALDALRAAEALGRGRPVFLLTNAAHALLAVDRGAEAAAFLQEANVAARFPAERTEALLLRAELALRAGDGDAALALCDAALEVAGEDPFVRPERLWLERARVAAGVGALDRADADLAHRTRWERDHGTVQVQLTYELVGCSIAARRGDPTVVERLGALAEAADPRRRPLLHVAALSMQAELLGAAGAWARAGEALSQADPADFPSLPVRVEVLRALGRLDEAERCLTHPADGVRRPWVALALVDLAAARGQRVPAIRPLQDQPWTWLYAARVHEARGEPAAARRVLDGIPHRHAPILLGAALEAVRARPR